MKNKIQTTHELMISSGERIKSHSLDNSEVYITEVESELGIKLPESYKVFLKKFGILSFNGENFYGITLSGKTAASIPSVIFASKSLRERGDASSSMINIKISGYGPNFCIDMSEVDENGEGAVYEVPLSFKRDGQKTKVADTFTDFFYDEIKAAVDGLKAES